MKNCGNFFNLTRKAKPVLSSINCTINVETCNISVHCWHTRLSFFIFVKKTSNGSWELFEEKLGNLMCSPKDFLMNRIYWTIDCCCSCHKHAFFREIWFFMFFYLLLMILVLRKKLIPLLKNLYTFSQKCNYRPNQILLTEHNLLLNVFSMFLFER